MSTENNIKMFNVDKDTYLSTVDNPFDPREDYGKWNEWDQDHGYYTERYLNNVAGFDADDTPPVLDAKLQAAILEIINNDPLDIYLLIK